MRFLTGLFFWLAAIGANAAYWDPIGTGGYIRDLEVSGHLYDVGFGWSSPCCIDDDFKDAIFIWNTQEEALIAANAVNTFLNGEAIRAVRRYPSPGNQTHVVAFQLVENPPNAHSIGVYSKSNVTYPAPPGWQILDDDRIAQTAMYTNWTDVSEVPLPAAAWLFGSALVGLVAIGRKKART